MPADPELTAPHVPEPADLPTGSLDPDQGGVGATPTGWSLPPLLRDEPSEHAPLVQPASPEVPHGPSGRYQLLGEIARGGMGVVLKGRDPDLGRDLAFKVLKADLARKPEAVQRFVEEAQVGGQLQHPGVVPVYDLGRFADGRPYFTMKLVKGRTLADLLASRADPSTDRGKYLQVFLQVCQTVAYAHSRGVIHRDLKPSNVMVGAFGEVLVMDWGLAKVLPRGGVADEERAARVCSEPVVEEPTVIRTARSGSGSETEAGSVLGTPAFMSPEQAGGEVDKLDERADVFGLGAVLCVILTGQPPYAGKDHGAVRLMAVRGQLADALARLDGCGADAELVGLCKRCLSPDRDDRPRDAGAVASVVATHLAEVEGRAQRAEVARATAEARAAEEANTRRVAEEKAAEWRKRQRVQYALALSVLGLLAVAGFAAWWVDGVRSARRAEQQAEEVRREAELKEIEAERKTRQVAYERDVTAALDEARLRVREGHDQADDPERWALTLGSAAFALKRAENLLASGEPTEPLRRAVATIRRALEQDSRDRRLLVELNRIADSNEIRLLMPISVTNITSRQVASAFRAHGIDLLAVPADEAVAWLKGHRLRARLVTAIRNWQQSLPGWAIDQSLAEAVAASAAVAGPQVVVALAHDPNRRFEKLLRKSSPRARLSAILNAVTDDPFTREWWEAVERKDAAKIQKLVTRPEIGRLSARELESLADGLSPVSRTSEVLRPLLAIARERFPGEFWVHFRTAFNSQFSGGRTDAQKKEQADESLRHLTAALAIRPNSALARSALGLELIDKRKDDPEGLRLLRSAARVDPTSPWPHLFLGMHALEKKDWPEAFRAMRESVRVDPDTGFFMVSAAALFILGAAGEPNRPADRDVVRFLEELIAAHPNHPGGYDLLGRYHLQTGDHRSALAQFRKAKQLVAPDYPGRVVLDVQLTELEAKARWGEKLPAVLRGEIRPANGAALVELADYCATFEKKFALATRFVAEGLAADPKLLGDWRVARFVGWAVQAGLGRGRDADTTTDQARERYRRLALEWMREGIRRRGKDIRTMGFFLDSVRDLAPVRDARELARLPTAERAEWEKLWAQVYPPKSKGRERAPPPREVQ